MLRVYAMRIGNRTLSILSKRYAMNRPYAFWYYNDTLSFNLQKTLYILNTKVDYVADINVICSSIIS